MATGTCPLCQRRAEQPPRCDMLLVSQLNATPSDYGAARRAISSTATSFNPISRLTVSRSIRLRLLRNTPSAQGSITSNAKLVVVMPVSTIAVNRDLLLVGIVVRDIADGN